MKCGLMALLGFLVAGVMASAPAMAERRVALVVGNANYANAVALRNPVNDAADMAAMLKRLGFDVTLATDVDESAFARQIDDFGRKLEGADIGLFYFAGHGLQVNDKNYLVSTNAKLESEFLVPSETIEVDAIIHLMESRAAVNLVFLDACRNDPLAENLRRSLSADRRSVALGRGLARVEPTGRDTLVAFSAAPGQEAEDGAGRNSPFAAALLHHMPEPGLEVSVMLKLVSAEVRRATNSAQRPQQLSDMTQAFYFAGTGSAAANPAAAPPPAQDRSVEVAFFQSAVAANDCGSIRAYLSRYPDGTFADLAKLTEQRLCSAKVTAAEPEKPTESPSRPALTKSVKAPVLAPPSDAPPLEAPAQPAEPPVLAALPPPDAPPPAAPPAGDLARSLQAELLRVGCGVPWLRASGEWDAASNSALKQFNRFAKTDLAGPDANAIAAVHSHDSRVCPLVCGSGTRARGDTCVAEPVQRSPREKQASRPPHRRRDREEAAQPSQPKQTARARPDRSSETSGPTLPTFTGNVTSFTGPGGRKCHSIDMVGVAPHIVCD